VILCYVLANKRLWHKKQGIIFANSSFYVFVERRKYRFGVVICRNECCNIMIVVFCVIFLMSVTGTVIIAMRFLETLTPFSLEYHNDSQCYCYVICFVSQHVMADARDGLIRVVKVRFLLDIAKRKLIYFSGKCLFAGL